MPWSVSLSRPTATPATSSSTTIASPLASIFPATASQYSTERTSFPGRTHRELSDKRMYRSTPRLSTSACTDYRRRVVSPGVARFHLRPTVLSRVQLWAGRAKPFDYIPKRVRYLKCFRTLLSAAIDMDLTNSGFVAEAWSAPKSPPDSPQRSKAYF